MSYNSPPGLLKRGRVKKYYPSTYEIDVETDFSTGTSSPTFIKRIKLPLSYASYSGAFIGSVPEENTPVVIAQGDDTNWYFVQFLTDSNFTSEILNKDALVLKSIADIFLSVHKDNYVSIGDLFSHIKLDAKRKNYISESDNSYEFTQSKRSINGIIRREKLFLSNFPQSAKLTSSEYDDNTTVIALDTSLPFSNASRNKHKNPAFVEDRELIYEFAQNTDILDEIKESSQYGSATEALPNTSYPNRHLSRNDTLSLNLFTPNALIETVKGTVVDIFGNILDLNRNPLPVGSDEFTLRKVGNSDLRKSYLNLRELQRKSIAYHFEINARKDLTFTNKTNLPDINSSADYARSRSRFFFDVDKEGMIKANIPASSETGNIPLLTRYENYSTFGTEDNKNPNKLIYREDNLDIFLDSFAFNGGSIEIKGDNSISSPIDRLTKQHIKHGTVYHDILSTCLHMQTKDFIDYQYTPSINIDNIPNLENIVSDTIIVAGEQANAGGRSGSLNFDGSIELNIGANTVDRQSLWLDTAGGVIANIGRDKNNVSAALSLDGDLLVQIGGTSPSNDSRFKTGNNYTPGKLDIRVIHEGFSDTMIRIDEEGVKILSPRRLSIHANEIQMRSDGAFKIDGEEVYINDRLVQKLNGGSI